MWNDVKLHYRNGSILMRLIFINAGVFLVLWLTMFFAVLFNFNPHTLVQYVQVPSHAGMLLHRPWTLLSYMFCHYEVFHILFNMLWLYWLGKIFLEYFTPKQLGALYVLGGVGGAALYVLAYAFLPYFNGKEGMLIGASASVLAIVVAIAVYAPHYRVRLLFLGELSIKWLTIITIAIMFLGYDMNRMGTQVAHVGGILVGLAFGYGMRSGHDITSWLNACLDGLMSVFARGARNSVGKPIGGSACRHRSEKSCNVSSKTPRTSQPTEAEIDVILDKLKRSGYGALTDKEKETLFSASSKKK